MATVLICIGCKNPITFKDSSPKVGRDWEHEIECKYCHAKYAVLVRLTQAPLAEVHVNAPS